MKKKYKVIAKVANSKFVKYNVNDLLQFTCFLDKTFPDWRFFNVYEYKKDSAGAQIANFTNKNRPLSRFLNTTALH